MNHAVDSAFKELIPSDAFPSYFIYFDINPEEIDINIHPTKTEINFQNNQVVYAMLNSTIKQSLGKFSIDSTFDFETEPGLIFNNPKPDQHVKPPTVTVNPEFNPFEQNKSGYSGGYTHSRATGRNQANKDWEKLFETKDIQHGSSGSDISKNDQNNIQLSNTELENSSSQENFIFQLHNKYIISNVRSGLMVIDQQLAHERILFENYLVKLDSGKGTVQQQLFPETWQLNAADVEIVKELFPDIIALGFDLEDFGDHSYIINGKPADLNTASGTELLEKILENYKMNLSDISLDKRVNLARSMAVQVAIKSGNALKKDEMEAMVNNLFACKMPEVSPTGKPIISILSLEEIERKFER